MSNQTFEFAAQTAEEISKEIQKNGPAKAFEELTKAVSEFQQQGYPIESIIPQGEGPKMGFALKSAKGEGFWKIYSRLLKSNLCREDGELRKLINTGINTSVGAVLTAIVTGLGIPPVALGIMIPITALIMNTGLEAFCTLSEEEK